MADTFKVEVYSPNGLELGSEASSVVLPTKQGEIGVLPHHCDYVGLLGSGLVKLERGSQVTKLLVSGGFCKFSDNKLVILADRVDIEISSADKAKRDDQIKALEARFTELSSYDPEWERVADEVTRLRAFDLLQ